MPFILVSGAIGEDLAIETQKKVIDLEKFYDMAVGRELRMKELKEEITSLKKELVKYKSDENKT